MWLEQCEITDLDSQVEISDGAMVKADVIADEFGLRKGANLAKINFRKERERILAKIPNIKDVRIRRILPGKVSIGVDERVPAVRIKGERGCVADLEGVVFRCQRQTQSLPVVKERAGANIQPGSKMSGMSERLSKSAGLPKSAMGKDSTSVEASMFLNSRLISRMRARISSIRRCISF